MRPLRDPERAGLHVPDRPPQPIEVPQLRFDIGSSAYAQCDLLKVFELQERDAARARLNGR